MRKPDPHRKREALAAEEAGWISRVVRPYLLDLLNKAQAKLAVPVRYEQVQGFDSLMMGEVDLQKEHLHDFPADTPEELVAFRKMLDELADAFRDRGSVTSSQPLIRVDRHEQS